MNRFEVNTDYKIDFAVYTDKVITKYGSSSQAAELEIVSMAEGGNAVAKKAFGDLIFYKRIKSKHPYRDAFTLYMEAAGLSVDDSGEWSISGKAYPQAFWPVGYYLVNYKCESVLANCETIDVIERMSRKDRLDVAMDLSKACLSHVKAPAAINLIGRIVKETKGDDAANEYFVDAANSGYVYACNNLAMAESERILQLITEDAYDPNSPDVKEHIEKYRYYLTTSADKYEPYAGNKLGLFYMTGEIKNAKGEKHHFKEYIDTAMAKEYFKKATVHPDVNSAWAFFNLIKYFHKEYDNNLDLLNEHMEIIKELNPKVYDIAIDL